MMKKSTAHEIAERFGTDGQQWEDDKNVGLDRVLLESGWPISLGRHTGVVRHEMPDDSAIITTTDYWYVGFPLTGCACSEDLGHKDGCNSL